MWLSWLSCGKCEHFHPTLHIVTYIFQDSLFINGDCDLDLCLIRIIQSGVSFNSLCSCDMSRFRFIETISRHLMEEKCGTWISSYGYYYIRLFSRSLRTFINGDCDFGLCLRIIQSSVSFNSLCSCDMSRFRFCETIFWHLMEVKCDTWISGHGHYYIQLFARSFRYHRPRLKDRNYLPFLPIL